MKQCPRCDFTFPDFHHVCDFDGAELIPDPERPSLVTLRPSRIRRCLKSPLFLAGLTALGLLSSALLIGYFDSASQSATISQEQSAPASDETAVPLTKAAKSPAQVKTPVPAKSSNAEKPKRSAKPSFAHLRPPAISPRAVAPVYRRTSIESPPPKSEIAWQRDLPPVSSTEQVPRAQPISYPQTAARPQPVSHDKEPKLTAMLKTTWRVLKRPFKF